MKRREAPEIGSTYCEEVGETLVGEVGAVVQVQLRNLRERLAKAGETLPADVGLLDNKKHDLVY